MNFLYKIPFTILLLPVLLGCSKEYAIVPYEITSVYADNMDNSHELVAAGDSVYKLAYVLRLTYVASVSGPYDQYESSFSLQDPFTDFVVTSSQDFDNNHPAGTSLNDLFNFGMTSVDGITLEKFNRMMNFPSRPVYFWLMVPPDQDGIHHFTIKFLRSSGNTLLVTTPDILLHS